MPGTLEDLDSEFLHDLRVSIRRARSVLRELKRRPRPGRAAAPARRAEVGAAADRPGARPRRPAARVGGADRAAAARARRRPRAAARAARAPPRARARRSCGAGCAARASRRALAAVARARDGGPPTRPPRTARTPRAPIEAVAGAPHPLGLPPHGPRRQRDRRRHARPRRCTTCASAARSCATCSSCSATRSRATWSSRWRSTLKDLQDVLGRFQDRAVQVELLRDLRDELAAEPGGPAALIALGPALDALLADQRGGARRVRRALRVVRRQGAAQAGARRLPEAPAA